MLEAIGNSFLLVALTEMGDKTQLLAFILAARFKKPLVVLAGIFVATVFNHLLAAGFGQWAASLMPDFYLRWVLAATFLIFAVWVLRPDQDDGLAEGSGRAGAFITTLVAFFLAEMGDKTQLSTVALAARYQDLFAVTIGTTLGMLAADGLAVVFGRRIVERISMKWIRWIAAGLFALFAVLILIGY